MYGAGGKPNSEVGENNGVFSCRARHDRSTGAHFMHLCQENVDVANQKLMETETGEKGAAPLAQANYT